MALQSFKINIFLPLINWLCYSITGRSKGLRVFKSIDLLPFKRQHCVTQGGRKHYIIHWVNEKKFHSQKVN